MTRTVLSKIAALLVVVTLTSLFAVMGATLAAAHTGYCGHSTEAHKLYGYTMRFVSHRTTTNLYEVSHRHEVKQDYYWFTLGTDRTLTLRCPG